MRRDLFQFDLPDELIARQPAEQRQGSRLLYLDSAAEDLRHQQFNDLLSHIEPGDLMVFNNTKVIAARLYGQKESGGKVEVLVERVLSGDSVLAHIRASKSPKPGNQLRFDAGYSAEMLGRADDLFELKFSAPVLDVLEQIGHMPLPPYIDRADSQEDKSRYQTVYAQTLGCGGGANGRAAF